MPLLHDVLRLTGGGDENESPAVLGEFTIILKNARSLSSDERLAELLGELSTLGWDAVLINESWRAQREEYDTLEQGHVWLGSGGMAGKRGVGI